MTKLLDFLAENVLFENTHSLFDYNVFSQRFITRFGFRLIRDDYTVEQIKTIAQNTLDVNLDFLTAFSKKVINPFETWGENDNYQAGITRTDTTTPDLTDTTTPDLTDTIQYRGTITNAGESGTTNSNFVNAYDSTTTSNPLSNSKATGTNNQTNTYNNDDTTTHTGKTTTTHTGKNEIISAHTGEDNTIKTGWNINDYKEALAIYYDFIDVIIDLIAADILYIIVRG